MQPAVTEQPVTVQQLEEITKPMHLSDLILEGCKDTTQAIGYEGNPRETCARGAAIHALVKRGWIKL